MKLRQKCKPILEQKDWNRRTLFINSTLSQLVFTMMNLKEITKAEVFELLKFLETSHGGGGGGGKKLA